MSYIVILSANSDIAKACAHEYAAKGYSLYLVAKNKKQSQILSDNLGVELHKQYSVDIQHLSLDVLESDRHKNFIDSLFNNKDTRPEGLIICTGLLGSQNQAQENFTHAKEVIDCNFSALVSICELFAQHFEHHKNGFIIGLSSVAGDRGRQSNYIYGASKAAFSTYLLGLGQRLHKNKVHVLCVKPGYVNSKMTEHLELPEALTVEPEDLAKKIYQAQQRNQPILYSQSHWRMIMSLINAIPESLFRRIKL